MNWNKSDTVELGLARSIAQSIGFSYAIDIK
jgi:hypothetical protein